MHYYFEIEDLANATLQWHQDGEFLSCMTLSLSRRKPMQCLKSSEHELTTIRQKEAGPCLLVGHKFPRPYIFYPRFFLSYQHSNALIITLASLSNANLETTKASEI
jgi:hypothetical protein